MNRLTPLTEGTEPALVDGLNRARTIELGQRPVNDQPKRPIVATNDEPVGLIREKDIRQKKARRILRRYGKPDKDPAVRGEGFGLASLDGCQSLRVVLDPDRLNGDGLLLQEVSQGLFCGGAMRLPAKSASSRILVPDVLSRLPPSTKVIRLKSTRSWRDRVAVVVPHSISTLPCATISIRFSAVSGTQVSLRFASPSCF